MLSFNYFLLFCLPLLLLSSCGSSKKTTSPQQDGIITVNTNTTATQHMPPVPNTKDDSLQIKYAHYLEIQPAQIQNLRLYRFIDQWLATPYKWGGTDEKGIDCSAFMQRLLSEVYGIVIPRTSIQQFFTNWVDKFGASAYLSEGDLVFFRTMDDKLISHVGLYLNNNMFVNASSSKGVSIANLKDPYWKRCFVAAGRVKLALLKKQPPAP
jgi:murein DD-endopeptidase / murein LD-carboxypeptidase